MPLRECAGAQFGIIDLHINIGTPDLCALVKTVSSTNIFSHSQGNFAEKIK